MVQKTERPRVLLSQVESPRGVLAGPGWADLASALEDLKERNSNAAAGAGRRGKEEARLTSCPALDTTSSFLSPDFHQMSHPAAGGPPIELGSGNFSVELGSVSYSRTPSPSNNSRASADHYYDQDPNHLSPDDISFLNDGAVRAMFKRVLVNEALMNQAIERLGGGGKGMKGLIGYIKLWVRQTRSVESSVYLQCRENLETLQQQEVPESSQGPSTVSDHSNASSPHGHHPKTTTWLEHGTDRSEANNSSSSSLKRPFPFEPLCQSADGAYFPHESKVHRLYGGAFSNMEINSGFSTREQLVSSITGEELTTNPAPTVSTSGMNPMNSPQGTFAYNNNMVNRPMASSLLLTGSRFGLDADNNSNLSPAASNRAARKNRLAQQRQVSCNVWKTDSLFLLFQKDLRPSDVGSLGRIVLPKKESETHLPYLTSKDGILVSMDDFDTGMAWSFRYRYWPNNRSRMYLLENTGEFVKAHDLERGDLLIIYRNPLGNLVIRGKKNGCSETFVPTGVHLPNDLATMVCSEGKSVKVEEMCDGRLHLNVPIEGFGMVAPFDTFLEDMMQGIQNECEQHGEQGLQPLERYASLDSDYVNDSFGLMAAEDSISQLAPKGAGKLKYSS